MADEPVLHYATDRRCYNGACCSDLQREIDSRENIFKTIKSAHPDYQCVYFPMEGKYLSFMKYREFGEMYTDRGECLLAAWKYLEIGRL